jgi:hypothetical protein
LLIVIRDMVRQHPKLRVLLMSVGQTWSFLQLK